MSCRQRSRSVAALVSIAVLGLTLGACGRGQSLPATTSGTLAVSHRHHGGGTQPPPTSTSEPSTTTTTIPTTTTTTLPPLGSPGAGLIPGHVTAIGDSVMIDAEPDLQHDIPGIDVEAFVSFQFYAGIGEVQTLRSKGRLGAIIVIGLGTNGPFSDSEFDQMMAACSGASRVVFINVHVGRPWQDEVNASLAADVARYPKVAVLADWQAIAAQHPEWFYSDGTHMPIGGPGAQALAALVASKVAA